MTSYTREEAEDDYDSILKAASSTRLANTSYQAKFMNLTKDDEELSERNNESFTSVSEMNQFMSLISWPSGVGGRLCVENAVVQVMRGEFVG